MWLQKPSFLKTLNTLSPNSLWLFPFLLTEATCAESHTNRKLLGTEGLYKGHLRKRFAELELSYYSTTLPAF
jgi:hypothetical protein